MRWMVLGLGVLLMAPFGWAGEDEDRLIGGVVSGLLGQPQQPSYTAQERERLVTMLQSGDYVTSRQGEPIDQMVYGVPLTHVNNVYTATPVRPSQVRSP